MPNICFVSPLIANGNVRRFLTENPSATRLPIVSLSTCSFRHEIYIIGKIQGTADGLAYLHSQSVIHGDLKGVCTSLAPELISD